jgi:tRNA(Arg) A34 adenosine deaminase TadA
MLTKSTQMALEEQMQRLHAAPSADELVDAAYSLLNILFAPPTIKDPEVQERHQIYCYLLFSLLNEYWNPYKHGFDGQYPWLGVHRPTQSQYLGHNIACIAVDAYGRVIDFDFNHNELFNSSIEHAEARLLRRLFALNHHLRPHQSDSDIFKNATRSLSTYVSEQVLKKLETEFSSRWSHYNMALSEVTIYTSLESCAQCAGMMALGSVREVVFLQPDPGQCDIGSILYGLNKSTSAFKAPAPIAANRIGVSEYDDLATSYDAYVNEIRRDDAAASFVGFDRTIPPSRSITAFLCTGTAKDILIRGAGKFDGLSLVYADYSPSAEALTNDAVLSHARQFLKTATSRGRRGTPHGR